MATLEDIQLLMQQGAQGFNNPWSQIMQNPSPQAEAQPPMSQPTYPEPEIPSYGSGSQVHQQDPQLMGLFNKLLARQNAGIDEQRKNLKTLEAYRDKEANRALDPDFTALMMASDAWGGTKFLPSYQRPQNDQEKAKEVLNADLMKQKALGGITDDEINLLKTQFYGLQALKQGSQRDTSKDQDQRQAFSKSDEAKKLRSLREMGNALKQYEGLIRGSDGYEITGDKRKQIESAYGDFKIKYKEAANLGALTGPDIKILEEVVAPASGIIPFMKGEVFTGGTQGVLKGIEQIKKNMGNDARINTDVLQKVYPNVADDLLQSYGLRDEDYKSAPRKSSGGGLTPAEAEELKALEKKYGGK